MALGMIEMRSSASHAGWVADTVPGAYSRHDLQRMSESKNERERSGHMGLTLYCCGGARDPAEDGVCI